MVIRQPNPPHRLRLAMVLFCAVAGMTCSDEPKPTEQSAPVLLTGTYRLVAVDGSPLPAPVAAFATFTMQVQSGSLRFQGATVTANAVGLLNTSPMPVTLGATGTYGSAVGNSFRTTNGLTGRVWADSAELETTGQTSMGAHGWRYVREAAVP